MIERLKFCLLKHLTTNPDLLSIFFFPVMKIFGNCVTPVKCCTHMFLFLT